MKGLNVLSLFDGISCGYEALRRANIKIENYFASEIDPAAIAISKANFPDIIYLGDIRNQDEWKLPKIDLIIGGSPCQDLSSANLKGKGLNGEMSSLFFEYLKAIKLFKPKYFLLENNYSMKKEYRNIISNLLGCEPVLINSSLVSAQNRRRLYWANFKITIPEDKGILFKDILLNLPLRDTKPFVFNSFGASHIGYLSQLKANCVTTKSSHSSQYYVNDDMSKMRTLSIEEAEALQTLPRNYTKYGVLNSNIVEIKPAERYKAVGNGWTVDVIVHIFECLKKEGGKDNGKI